MKLTWVEAEKILNKHELDQIPILTQVAARLFKIAKRELPAELKDVVICKEVEEAFEEA